MKHLLFAIVLGLTAAACTAGWNDIHQAPKNPEVPCGYVRVFCGKDSEGYNLCCPQDHDCGGSATPGCPANLCCSRGRSSDTLFGAGLPVAMTREMP